MKFSAKTGINWFKRLIKEDVGLVYTALGSLGSAILGALFWFILASVLEVENYGLANYYIALASIFAALGTIGLDTTITTYLAKGERETLYAANSLSLISGLLSAFVLSIFQLFSGFLSASMIFFAMTMAEILGEKMYRQYAFVSIGHRLGQITLSILLYTRFGIPGIILGYFLGAIIFSYKYFKSISKFTLKFDSLKEKRNFTFHSYGFNLIKTFSTYLDKVVIAPLFGYHTLGLYQLGFQFFMFLSTIPMSLYQYLLPEESSGKDKTKVKLISLILAVATSLLVFALTPYLIKYFFASFTESVQVVSVMSLAVIPSTISAIQNATLLGKEKSKTVFTAGLIYLAALTIGFITMGKIISVLGLGLALVIAQTIQATYLSIKTNLKSTIKAVNIWKVFRQSFEKKHN
ncbi:oligosaccharide flippase family protein [Candidatus Bathyarchaeota archaeon]|nr:oligosaccharide flippase family protein [Candidatus Bathyarchaeota archaeon]